MITINNKNQKKIKHYVSPKIKFISILVRK